MEPFGDLQNFRDRERLLSWLDANASENGFYESNTLSPYEFRVEGGRVYVGSAAYGVLRDSMEELGIDPARRELKCEEMN